MSKATCPQYPGVVEMCDFIQRGAEYRRAPGDKQFASRIEVDVISGLPVSRKRKAKLRKMYERYHTG